MSRTRSRVVALAALFLLSATSAAPQGTDSVRVRKAREKQERACNRAVESFRFNETVDHAVDSSRQAAVVACAYQDTIRGRVDGDCGYAYYRMFRPVGCASWDSVQAARASRFQSEAQEYRCVASLTEQVRGSPLHLGDGPCQVLLSYGAEFETRHVTTAAGASMTWYYDVAQATFWFTWKNDNWVLTDAVTH